MVFGAVPGLALRLGGIHLGTAIDTTLFGLSIVTAAFLLSWAAEASEVDVAQGIAVAMVALIAVLPEYAVDMSLAWKAGTDPSFAPFAIANMTGGNRLLIGVAWPLVFFLYWLRTRSRVLRLDRRYAAEAVALGMATLYSFTLPFKGGIAIYDAVILGAIFIVYISVIARSPAEEPELVGPAASIGRLPRFQRRAAIALMLVYSAVAIIAVAESFAEGLIEVGTEFGIDQFLLVQWLAPLASEAPEFLVAAILAWRGRAGVALGVLLSSKVNQWTLLVGSLPIVFGISGGTIDPLPLDARQQEEVLLTAAQSLFAVAVLASLSLGWREALLLFLLFSIQFVIPVTAVRLAISGIYLVLAVAIGLHRRAEVRALLRDAWSVFRHPEHDPGAEHHGVVEGPGSDAER